jgi:hypothetical protein
MEFFLSRLFLFKQSLLLFNRIIAARVCTGCPATECPQLNYLLAGTFSEEMLRSAKVVKKTGLEIVLL